MTVTHLCRSESLQVGNRCAPHRLHRVLLLVQENGMRHTVYYPTPAALAARIQLAEQLGVGLSIWELGQGMDSFLDLL